MPEDRAGRALRILRRGLALRCPRCGERSLFPPPRGAGGGLGVRVRAWFTMAEACPLCGLRFERAQGYWVGAIYVGYGVTTVIAVAGYFVLWATLAPPTSGQLALWGAFVVAFPLWFFRWSRSLWLAVEFLVNPEP